MNSLSFVSKKFNSKACSLRADLFGSKMIRPCEALQPAIVAVWDDSKNKNASEKLMQTAI